MRSAATLTPSRLVLLTLTLVALALAGCSDDAGQPAVTDGGGGGGETGPGPLDGGGGGPAGWPKGFGDEERDIGYVLAIDSAGNVIMGGIFEETINYGAGKVTAKGITDAYLISYAPTGTVNWFRHVGTKGDTEKVRSIYVDSSDNVYISGFCTDNYALNLGGKDLPAQGDYDLYLAKYNQKGVHQWSARYGSAGGGAVSEDLRITAAKELVMTGYFKGTLDLGGGKMTSLDPKKVDAFVAVMDLDGKHKASWAIQSDSTTYGYATDSDAAGNLVTLGFFQGKMTLCGKDYNAGASADVYLAGMDNKGTCRWHSVFSSGGADQSTNMVLDSSGNIYITGKFGGSSMDFGGTKLTSKGSTDIFAASFDKDGKHRWSTSFGGSRREEGNGLYLYKDQLYLAASFEDTVTVGSAKYTSKGNIDALLIRLKAKDGAYDLSRAYGSTSTDFAYAVVVDPTDDAVYLSGEHFNTIDFEGKTLTSNGRHDVFLAKLNLK